MNDNTGLMYNLTFTISSGVQGFFRGDSWDWVVVVVVVCA